MSTPVDLNPFPLGLVAPTSGTPLPILNNFPSLAQKYAKTVLVYAPKVNTGIVYIGRSTMVRSTYVGVLLALQAGERVSLPFDDTAGNYLDLSAYYVDVDTTGDKAVLVALFQ